MVIADDGFHFLQRRLLPAFGGAKEDGAAPIRFHGGKATVRALHDFRLPGGQDDVVPRPEAEGFYRVDAVFGEKYHFRVRRFLPHFFDGGKHSLREKGEIPKEHVEALPLPLPIGQEVVAVLVDGHVHAPSLLAHHLPQYLLCQCHRLLVAADHPYGNHVGYLPFAFIIA